MAQINFITIYKNTKIIHFLISMYIFYFYVFYIHLLLGDR